MAAPLNLAKTAFAFRGYNVTNLGSTAKLLAVPRYRPTLAAYLNHAAEILEEVVGRRVDLIARIERGDEPDLEAYDEAIAIIIAVEMAQIEILRTHFACHIASAQLAFGYSLGEIVALAAGGTLTFNDALRVPLAMAKDCASLAHDACMGIVFSRAAALDAAAIRRLCLEINTEGQGVIGISSYLSPNSVLVLGQRETVSRLEARIRETMGKTVHVRRNAYRWPPLHTPIVWQCQIPNRAGVMMHLLRGGCRAPAPKVLSMVTGKYSYDDDNARDLILQWIDHPQRLWDVVCETLASGVETIIHVGPEANLIPATFERIANNVLEQIDEGSLPGRLGLRAVRRLSRLAWLRGILPTRASLLRAPQIRHIRLEDWLLENAAG